MQRESKEVLLIDKTGRSVFSSRINELQLSSYEDARFSEGLIDAYDCEQGNWGYVDKTGKFVIEPKYVQAARFSEGLARVAVVKDGEEKVGFIDHSGQFVIPPKFNTDGDFRRNSTDFSEGVASLTEGLRPTVTKEEKVVYLDKNGSITLFTDFFSAGSFRNGLASVYDAKSNKFGFIDKSGRLRIPLQYDLANSFSEGLAVVAILR